MLEASAAQLRETLREGGSIVDAEPLTDEDGDAIVGLMFGWRPDDDEKPVPQNPRRFDILFAVALLLMDWAGVRVYFHDPDRKGELEYFLRVGPHGQPRVRERIYVARMVRDTPAGVATPFASDHRSYRYKHLDQAPPRNNLPAPSVGRPDAIKLAVRCFEENFPDGLQGITAREFGELLSRVLATATAYHGEA